MFLPFASDRGWRHRAFRPCVETLEDRQCPSGSYLLVGSYDTDEVLRYDASTGDFVDVFVRHRSGGLNQPFGLVFGPHDGHLYVSTGHFQGPGQIKAVLRYDGTTGAFIDEFVRRGQMIMPHAVMFGPDGNLYVGDKVGPGPQGRMARFDGLTGEFLDDFVPLGEGGTGHPFVHLFGPDGNGDGQLDFYVADEFTHSILRYDGTTGAFLDEFVPRGSGGLVSPLSLTFGPDGNLYVADFATLDSGAVLRYQGPSGITPGAFLDVFVPPGRGGLLGPLDVLFGPDHNGDGHQDLYVASTQLEPSFLVAKNHTSSVKVYDGITGAYLSDFVAVGSGGLDNPGLMTFTQTDPVTRAYTGEGLTAASRIVEPDSRVRPSLADATADGNGLPVDRAVGHTTRLDAAPADWIRFVDAIPRDNQEFFLFGYQGEEGRMPPAMTLIHEQGLLLDLGPDEDSVQVEAQPAGTHLGTNRDPDAISPGFASEVVFALLAAEQAG